MELATKGIYDMYSALTETAPIEDILLQFVRQIEVDGTHDHRIGFFVFALRAFFCWPRALELCGKDDAIKKIRGIWIQQNHAVYDEWLTSCKDESDALRWEKWTFQAKNSILEEFLASNVCAPKVGRA